VSALRVAVYGRKTISCSVIVPDGTGSLPQAGAPGFQAGVPRSRNLPQDRAKTAATIASAAARCGASKSQASRRAIQNGNSCSRIQERCSGSRRGGLRRAHSKRGSGDQYEVASDASHAATWANRTRPSKARSEHHAEHDEQGALSWAENEIVCWLDCGKVEAFLSGLNSSALVTR